MSILLTQIKPNPLGKDRNKNDIPNVQLIKEWIDITNFSNQTENLSGLRLTHKTYTTPIDALFNTAGSNKDSVFLNLNKVVIGANKTIRIHSGDPVLISSLEQEEKSGIDLEDHYFTGIQRYSWNNTGDIAKIIRPDNSILDYAEFSGPTDGKVLKRLEDSNLFIEY